jgi:tRNA(His) 5'-end guanylyltransferase
MSKKNKDSLGTRMKRYEAVNQSLLPLHSYVVVRVDGRAFHTYTAKMGKPFDAQLMATMDATTIALCKEMQNAVLGYVQSDEISILLYDKGINTQPWFDNEVEKIVSVSASIATSTFNQQITLAKFEQMIANGTTLDIIKALLTSKQAQFDSRVFVLPNVDEVVNYFLWRYRDWTRNSINTVGQTLLGKSATKFKTTNQVQEMLFEQKGVNWNDYSIREKRGGLCVKTDNGWKMVEMPHVVCEPENEFYKLIL